MMKNFAFKLNSHECHIKCDIQKICFEIVLLTCTHHLPNLAPEVLAEINKTCNDIFLKSSHFNGKVYLRYFLQSICGFRPTESTLPGFADLEKTSITCILLIYYFNQAKEQNTTQLLDDFMK